MQRTISYRRRSVHRVFKPEPLESRRMLTGHPMITELMASNDGLLQLADGTAPDWVEIHNSAAVPIDLEGYRLTDDPTGRGWSFPSVTLEPDQYLVVYASGKDVVDQADNLHTNFRLSAQGEYLALVSPDEIRNDVLTDGQVVSEYHFPEQVPDVSYGVVQTSVLVNPRSEASYAIPFSATLGDRWTEVDFDSAANGFVSSAASIGYEDLPGDRINFSGQFQTEVPSGIHAAYLRTEFVLEDASSLSTLLLRLKYDNGFVAYLNGAEIARENVPDNVDWFSEARTARPRDSDVLTFAQYDLTDRTHLLVDGKNVLAIHALNKLSDKTDFLLVPELLSNRPVEGSSIGYLPTPTPGSANLVLDAFAGPTILDVTDVPGELAISEDMVISAKIQPLNHAVDTVTLSYQVMFDGLQTMSMVDDGTGGDLTTGDGIYSASIPASVAEPGQMIRWRVTTTDVLSNVMRWPLGADPENSDAYFGAMVTDASVSSELPVFYWFTDNPRGAAGDGARASVFYNGQFYENVLVQRRGHSSNVGPKKMLKFDFNPGHEFQIDPQLDRVGEININSTYFDKSYVRQTLAWETFREAGSPYSLSFPLRTQLNGDFYSVAVFVEQVDRDYLRRNGLDPDGALYKARQAGNDLQSGSVANITKHTRRHEDNSDLKQLVDGIRPTLPQEQRATFVFDHVNIPGLVNYLATMALIHGNDHHAKNYYLYRDTEGTGQWMFLPWDFDLSFGKNFASTNDAFFADELPGGHPFWGSSEYPRATGANQWNGLIDAVLDTPAIREMYLRRLRTLMDQILQPPDTPASQLKYEARLDALMEQMQAGVVLDDAAWNEEWGTDYSFQQNIERIKRLYLAPRREYLFHTHSIDNVDNFRRAAGIPYAQAANPRLQFDQVDVDFNPASGNQDEEYVRVNNPNDTAVDISEWRIRGGIEHTFVPGTVIPAGGAIYLAPNAKAFRARATGPAGGQQLLVQGNYEGHLSNFGEALELVSADETVVDTLSTPSVPSDVQRLLRVSELHYNPSGDDDTEFIELTNISSGVEQLVLDLSGVTISAGPREPFVFPDGVHVAPGASVLVVKDQAAFQNAYPDIPASLVVGTFVGSLANGGERIRIDDTTGSTVVDFVYDDIETWPLPADGAGPSLELIDVVATPRGELGNPGRWRASAQPGGSPGAADLGPTNDLVPQPGDANRDRQFAFDDIVLVLQSGKFNTDQLATWAEGDWDGDGLFTAKDLVAALASGNYGIGPYADRNR